MDSKTDNVGIAVGCGFVSTSNAGYGFVVVCSLIIIRKLDWGNGNSGNSYPSIVFSSAAGPVIQFSDDG